MSKFRLLSEYRAAYIRGTPYSGTFPQVAKGVMESHGRRVIFELESCQRFHLILRSVAPSARQLRDRVTSGPLEALKSLKPGLTAIP
jgi:hypothetical protein